MPDIYTVYCITIQDIVVTSFMTAVRHAAAADTFTLSPAHELVTSLRGNIQILQYAEAGEAQTEARPPPVS